MDNFREALVEDEAETANIEDRASDLKARMKVLDRADSCCRACPWNITQMFSFCVPQALKERMASIQAAGDGTGSK